MQVTRKILVPIDGSKNSMRGLMEAILLADYLGSSLVLLHVIPGLPPLSRTLDTKAYERFMRKKAEEFFGKARKVARGLKSGFEERIIFGVPQQDIAVFASRNKFDMIVMGSHGMGRMKGILLGSVSNATLQRSRVPVLIVR